MDYASMDAASAERDEKDAHLCKLIVERCTQCAADTRYDRDVVAAVYISLTCYLDDPPRCGYKREYKSIALPGRFSKYIPTGGSKIDYDTANRTPPYRADAHRHSQSTTSKKVTRPGSHAQQPRNGR
jgi:hypothetical protein